MNFVLQFCHWSQGTQYAEAFRQADFLFPLVEGTHIMAMALSVGLIFMLDLRLLRIAFCSEPVTRIMRQVMPWALPAFGIMFVTGLALFLAQAENVFTNGYFRMKMLLLLLLALNAVLFQFRFYPHLAEWDTAEVVPVGAQAIAVISLVFWFAVIACGRMMAYEL